jgi:hypothetical protein
MTKSAARFPADATGLTSAQDGSSRTISAIDEQAFIEASERLTLALDQAASGRTHDDIAVARQRLRELAVRLRDAGYWRTDKHGLRATVSLLWQADRYVSEMALNRAKGE